MEQETVKIISDYQIILSEDENSDTVDAKFIICDFDPNGNDVQLNRNTIEDWLDTLVNKPFVGKVVTRYDGKEDFSGHNVKIVEETDKDGQKYKTVEFDTHAFGTFYKAGIETIDEVEYITANAKIWKRFKKAFSVFKKRAESKKGLKTSWEISVSESHKEKIKNKNVKVIDSGVFIGHCALGENITPAYQSSGVIDVASLEQDEEFAQAFSSDVLSMSSEDDLITTDINNLKENTSVSKRGSEKVDNKHIDTNQTSALTENDVYRKVRKAINNSSTDKYYYLSMIQPYEYKAYAYDWNREKDSDFIEFTYSVNSDDTISITSQQDVEMIFKPKTDIDSQLSEFQEKLSEAERQIAEAGKLLTDAKKEKEEIEAQVSQLQPFKDRVEEMEKAEKERELAEKKEELKTFALEDNLISEADLERDDQLTQIFAELTLDTYETSQEKIEVIKGRRAIAKFKESCTNQDLETSQVQAIKKPKTDLNNSDSDAIKVSAKDIIKGWIGK